MAPHLEISGVDLDVRDLLEYEREEGERTTVGGGSNSGGGPEIGVESFKFQILFVPLDIRILLSLTNSHRDAEQSALLIDEQDDILDHLEMAEIRYIASLRI